MTGQRGRGGGSNMSSFIKIGLDFRVLSSYRTGSPQEFQTTTKRRLVSLTMTNTCDLKTFCILPPRDRND